MGTCIFLCLFIKKRDGSRKTVVCVGVISRISLVIFPVSTRMVLMVGTGMTVAARYQ
jgi:hypothetical protein